MKPTAVSGWLVVSLVTFGLAGCGGIEGDSGVPLPVHDPHAGGGEFTQLSEAIELFAYYPHQIAGTESEEPWEVHLTWVDGWQPVDDATVAVAMVGPGGAREQMAAEPVIPGVYLAAPTLPAAGTWQAEFAVSVDGEEYTIPAGPFEVFESEEEIDLHAGHAHAENELAHEEDGHLHDEDEIAHEEDGHLHDEDEIAHEEDEHLLGEEMAAAGLITLPKEEQWSFPFAVAVAEEREIAASIPAAGELVAPPGGLVHVSSPVAGLIQVDGPSLGPGDLVRTGQVLALIAPISLDNSYVRTRADVVAAELEAERAERLFAAEAISSRRLEEARRDLDVALAAFEAIGGTSGSVTGDGADAGIYSLRSPIDGVVTVRDAALGQQVDVGEHAFTIVNSATLWLVARVPARYAAETNGIRGAWFTVEGGTDTYTTDRVLSVGSMIESGSRTLPVRFAVANGDRVLKVGMLAEGHVLVGEPITGVAVPVSAIQNENGLPVVYVKVTGDTFDRRVVDLGASDGSWTLVSSGIEFDEQVVTVGAYQVNLASLGTIEPGDGHAH
ncbi:MAG: efflux RND transporter periplasmic adaptor subunit [Gammaproteobacteria bacterium]|nr:efflux RND transporter periplasmic adaptor subunit [Gammaproteobacteria bacterium]MDE0248404.1 efflux RND transporter periplasmic adaptor subunit [Gammaproteobacteria bacterium]